MQAQRSAPDSNSSATRHHLVLGGSQGIGFAYAAHMAAKGDALTIVARRSNILADARKRLLQTGATSVDTIRGDLLDAEFRNVIKNSHCGFDSIFISGPSPPAGGPELTSNPHWHQLATRACEAGLIYPYDFTHWAFERGVASAGTIVLVTSAVTLTHTPDQYFFLSQTYRSALERIAQSLQPIFSNRHVQLNIWRPKVVLTELAMAYATSMADASKPLTVTECTALLAHQFGENTIPSASEYVDFQLRK